MRLNATAPFLDSTIYAPLDFKRPFLASLRRRNVSLTYFPFRGASTRHDPELSFAKVAKTCALR